LKKRYKILTLGILLTVIIASAVAAYVYSEYVPRVLVDDSLTLKESHQWQFDLYVLGNRNVNITVRTVQYLVFVTFWYQQNQAATTYLFDKQVTNTTQGGFNVSVQQSGTLVDDSLTLKESHQWQFDLYVLGNRNVNITVRTVQYLVFVTFWHQQNQAATTYLFDKQVTNTTQGGFNVSVQQGGTYYLSVQKTEQYGENVTTLVHVEVIS